MNRSSALAACCVLTLCAQQHLWADVAGDVRALTGKHTRLAWFQSYLSELVVLDTDDGQGVRLLVSEGFDKKAYDRAYFTSDGERLVYNKVTRGYENPEVFVIVWVGTGQRKLLDGAVTETWNDAATGTEWLYVVPGIGPDFGPVRMVQLDNVAVSRTIWDKTGVGFTWFTVSADGTRAGSAMPSFGTTGVLTLPNGEFTTCGDGCWCGIAPDNSYRFLELTLHPRHEGINVYDWGCANKRYIDLRINTPGITMIDAVSSPKWSNDVRFITMIAPDPNQGAKPDIYMGRFNAAFDGIEAWVQMTDGQLGGNPMHEWQRGYHHSPTAWTDSRAVPTDSPRKDSKRVPGLSSTQRTVEYFSLNGALRSRACCKDVAAIGRKPSGSFPGVTIARLRGSRNAHAATLLIME